MKRTDTTSAALADYDGTGTKWFCLDKMILSRQNGFCLDKMDSVSTKSILSQQNGFCGDKMFFVETKLFCRDKMDFVATEWYFVYKIEGVPHGAPYYQEL